MGGDQEKITLYYDTYAEQYAKMWASTDSIKADLERFTELLKKRDGKDVLDAGCGHGRDVKYFSNAGFNVIGVDLSDKLIKIAKELNPNGKLFKMDLLSMIFYDNAFDGIWSCGSLLHIDREKMPIALKEFQRVIKDNGVLYLSIKRDVGKREEYVTLQGETTGRRFVYYAIDEIDDMLTAAGFDMVNYLQKETRNGVWMSIFCGAKK